MFMCIILTLTSSNNINMYLEAIFLGTIFCLLCLITLYLLKKGQDILTIHMLVKEIEHDKQIRTTLFQI